MTFGATEWLWGLLMVPLLIALFVRSEHRGLKRLQQFVSARLLPQLSGTVNRRRRIIRFGLLLLGLALAIVSLAQPRWGYTFEDVKRKGLDLLIAVDTSLAHLAGAMAKPVWTLIPYICDWRWMFERSDSPWYPTMRLFRQRSRAIGEWPSVIREVASELSRVVDEHRKRS